MLAASAAAARISPCADGEPTPGGEERRQIRAVGRPRASGASAKIAL